MTITINGTTGVIACPTLNTSERITVGSTDAGAQGDITTNNISIGRVRNDATTFARYFGVNDLGGPGSFAGGAFMKFTGDAGNHVSISWQTQNYGVGNSVMTLSKEGNLGVPGYFVASGTATIGQISASNASFQNTSGKALAYGDAAITQGSSGATTLNSSAGQVTYLSINNAAVGTVSASGIASSGFLYAGTTLKTGGYTVATLPAAATGMRTYVTDAVAPTYLGALVGGGAVVVPVFYNGSAWVSD